MTKRKGLSDKQRSALSEIMTFIETKGRPPTLREMQPMFDVTSLRGVVVHLDAMAERGYIQRDHGKNGGLKVLMDRAGTPVTLEFAVKY